MTSYTYASRKGPPTIVYPQGKGILRCKNDACRRGETCTGINGDAYVSVCPETRGHTRALRRWSCARDEDTLGGGGRR